MNKTHDGSTGPTWPLITDDVYLLGKTPAKPNVEDWKMEEAVFMMNTDSSVSAKNSSVPGLVEREKGRGRKGKDIW